MQLIYVHHVRIGAAGYVLTAVLLTASPAWTADVSVAVAANFTGAMKALITAFQAASKHTVVMSTGSTGTLYAQTINGAPYDVFLSADSETPRRLEAEGQAVAGGRFTYAFGKLVLWCPVPGVVDSEGGVLKTAFQHLAIANPATAPYGAAAEQVLRKMGLWDSVRGRIVQGENVTQTFQFAASGNADIGFVAYSQFIEEGSKGSCWVVPDSMYSPLEQQVVLLKRAHQNSSALELLAFLKGPVARAIIVQHGYRVP